MKKHSGALIARMKGCKVIDCRGCGFKHVYPLPPERQLSKLYSQKFYSLKKPDYFKNAEEDRDWWNKVYDNYFRLLEKHTRARKLLDIGSGPGYFLKCGQNRGWKVLGFEPSRQAYDYSQKLGVRAINDYFNFTKAQKYGRFDAVSLILTLEHLPDPIQILKDIKKILKPTGLVLIISPNDFNPFQQILHQNLKFDPWWVVPSQHINYFDFNSIQKTLKNRGFKIIDALASFPMEIFLLSGENYVNQPQIGRKCHQKRKNFEMNLYQHNPELLNKFYRDLAKNNLGREFVIIGRKNG